VGGAVGDRAEAGRHGTGHQGGGAQSISRSILTSEPAATTVCSANAQILAM
jgi:hypothetical protein